MKASKTTQLMTVNALHPRQPSHVTPRSFQDKHDDRRENKDDKRSGLPDSLIAAIKGISGVSLDDVRVNYNSPEPARFEAHAFARGTDIHVAPGRESDLPHEAWHVVQQKQGRVRPSAQMHGRQINEDARLEDEADRQGANAIQDKKINLGTFAQSPRHGSPVMQLNGKKKKGKYASKKDAPSREAAREAKYASTTAGGTTIFNNAEGRLPKAGKGQQYIETDVGAGRHDRGRRRIVSLTEEKSGRVLKQYNTDDHYKTFH